MAGNYSSAGGAVTLTSPTGGTASGVPVAVNDMLVIPMEDTVKGQPFTAVLGGAWVLPVTGALKAGKKVGWLNGSLVAADTVDSIYYGKLLSDVANGYAEALLIQ